VLKALRQFRDIHGNPSCLITRQQLRRRSPPRLILEIDIRKLLSVVIADDKADGQFFGNPGRWEARDKNRAACGGPK
jgi:hypothetical protein